MTEFIGAITPIFFATLGAALAFASLNSPADTATKNSTLQVAMGLFGAAGGTAFPQMANRIQQKVERGLIVNDDEGLDGPLRR